MALNIPVPGFNPSPISTSLARQNALTLQNIQNQIKGVEAYYAPYTNYANALSKTAYGLMAPATALAQFMNSPAASNLSREQVENIGKQIQQYTNLFPNYMNNLPQPNMMNQQQSFGGNLMNALLSKIGFGTPESTTPNSVQNLPVNMAQPAQNNINMPTTQPENVTSQFTGQGIPTANSVFSPGGYTRQASNTIIPGSVGGYTPGAAASAQTEALKTGAIEEASKNVDTYTKMSTEDNAIAENAIAMNNQLDRLAEARSGLTPYLQKGPIGGHLPAITSAAQTYDSTLNNIVTTLAKAQSQGGSLTNDARSLAANQKMPRTSQDSAFNELEQYTRGMNLRDSERPQFNEAMRQAQFTPQQTKILWNYYQSKKPYYNAKEKIINQDNIGSWADFYQNLQNVKNAFSPQGQKDIAKTMLPTDAELPMFNKNKTNKQIVTKNSNVEKIFDLTQFKDANDFQNWLRKQNSTTRAQVKRQIEAGVY